MSASVIIVCIVIDMEDAVSATAWDSLNLAGHNHRHVCTICSKILWHQGKASECVDDFLCCEPEDDAPYEGYRFMRVGDL